jgi:hypothetical protein
MLVIKLHQAGSATLELQQHVWMAIQGVRARYPEAQGIIGGEITRGGDPKIVLTQVRRATGKDTP